MGIIELPLLTIGTSIAQAMDEMRQRQRSGVVGDSGDALWVFRAWEMVVQKARGARSLDDLERRWVIHQFANEDVSRIDFANVYADGPAVERLLDQAGKQFALSPRSSGSQTAQIITRHEKQRDGMSQGPADCYCENPNLNEPHSYKPPPIPKDHKCTLCEYKIVCV
jgi:hypothetical protein